MRWFMRSSQYEVVLCFAVYIVYLLYGLWAVFRVRNLILKTAKIEFTAGWTVLNRPRDDSNDELENFTTFVTHNWIWYVVHTVVSAMCRTCWPKGQSSCYAVVSATALLVSLRILSVTFIVALLTSYYVIANSGSKSLTWCLSAIWMITINVIKNSEYLYGILGYTEYFTLIIILSWSLLRGCSFALSRINDVSAGVPAVGQVYSLEHFLGYTLYFPSLVYGPFLCFQRYTIVLQPEHQVRELKSHCLTLLWELLRVGLWWLVLQFALHFLYVHYMACDVSAVQLVGPVLGQHAVGYFMGQFFYLYYVVTYGLGIAFARFDGLNPPNRPRCIGCIHFYSDMWKYFDAGLYEFLFKHIYAALCSKKSPLKRKLLAIATTFAFVFMWHGFYTYVFVWSALNFSCLVAEKFFKAIVSSRSFSKRAIEYFGIQGALRIRALLATQIFIPAAFSNVYFISGEEVGNYMMRGAYMSGLWNYLALTFCSYCFFQCSEVILNVRKSGKLINKKM